MRKLLPLLLAATACAPLAGRPAPDAASSVAASDGASDAARWERHAQAITITRDDWGIAHVRGRTDADAVFGMVYAQAEDDFNRVETNYLNAMGRLAEVEGEGEIWRDLRMKLFIHPDTIRARYAASPPWLRTLATAWADGLNYYLHTHPQVKPRLITRFEPWMALTFTEGSIGGDIAGISLQGIEAFYSKQSASAARGSDDHAALDREPRGSNGIAIAPQNTETGRALLLINPHTSFFFRSELQMTSDEGLNAYGAVTWGQFFIYQGFNDRLGWMHTTSTADVVDEFAETIVRKGDRLAYRHGGAERPVIEERVVVPYRTASGATARREFTVYRTHHGPVVREADGKWVTVSLMNRPIEALSQSYLRTKARDLASFRKVMDFHANTSNNTLYADADGNIAYFHPQFVPKRDDRFDWTKPVDGSDAAAEWRGVHAVEETPVVVNPPNGWVYNTNNWPYSAAGPNSPKREAFPRYMDAVGENARGIHALRVLGGRRDFNLQRLIDAAFDPWMPAFAETIPTLVAAWDALPASDPLKGSLADQVAALRAWDHRWSAASVPTSLAMFWGDELGPRRAAAATPAEKLRALAAASARLTADFGTWRTPWGEINRFQRLTGDIVQKFDDAAPSSPVPFASATWGSLASFGARRYPGTKRWYGTSGNSFVAAVEFGRDSVRARAVSAGGESGDPRSRHFNDQAERYATGNFREVYFYPSQLRGHTERTYRPGQ
jgi:acyl-homoserine-lactone acylase